MRYEDLKPFVEGDLRSWRGLPTASSSDLDHVLGRPEKREVSKLGYHPAERYVYALDVATRGLMAYVRDNRVVLIEAIQPPPISAIEDLPKPCGIKPQEILVPNAYAHEYVYCEIGLILTIARALKGDAPDLLARCRGIRPIAAADEFGPDYYKPFEDQIAWSALELHSTRPHI